MSDSAQSVSFQALGVIGNYKTLRATNLVLADIWTQRKRSEVVSLIRGKGNKETEQALLSLLKRNKITGWRRRLPLPGKPDFAYQLIAKATYLRLHLRFPKHKVAVFVDGWLMAFASLQTVPPLRGYLR